MTIHAAPYENRPFTLSRRSFVAAGLGLGIAAGLAGCSSGGALVDPAELEEAQDSWNKAYTDTEMEWQALQMSIDDAEEAQARFASATVTTPDELAAFEEALAEAQAVENGHEDLVVPDTIEACEEGEEELVALGDTYFEASAALIDAQALVKVATPGQGSFDLTDPDGYSYHVEYSIDPTITIDSSRGKPGMVGLNVDFTGSWMRVENTTPGKEAPGISFKCSPLYPIALFESWIAERDNREECALFGPMASPVSAPEGGEATIDFVEGIAYSQDYIDPFESFNDGYVDPDDGLGWRAFFAGVAEGPANGQREVRPGDNMEMGEVRTLEILMGGGDLSYNYSSYATSDHGEDMAGSIPESYAESFKQIQGWALYPLFGSTLNERTLPQEPLVFAGQNVNDWWTSDGGVSALYVYNPIPAA